MIVPDSELIAILREMNPWWRGEPLEGLPTWRRAAFAELELWLRKPPARRAVLLSGARQIGKTTLFLQAIESLIASGVPASNVLYVTFDHPLLKLAGLESVLRLWQETEHRKPGPEYLFVDEIQFLPNWQTWVKHQVDFQKERRIALTGSATPLVAEGQESGVGRWHTIRLATLSFYEFLRIRKSPEPNLPDVPSLSRLAEWGKRDFSRASEAGKPLAIEFNEYLQRGGFPQCALAPTVNWAQKLLREDIVDMQALCQNLAVNKPTVTNFIELLATVHLIHKLSPLGYGKEVLRGRHKIYLADAAIGPSVLSKGRGLLTDDTLLGQAVETAFFKHVFTRFYDVSVQFAYWHGKKEVEVDIVADVEGRLVPFEVKYRGQSTGPSELKGLREFCATKKVKRGYVITRSLSDFGVLKLKEGGIEIELIKIPASLACYWLGRSELQSANREET
jgi:predicted AAA+ superfamily ATPase